MTMRFNVQDIGGGRLRRGQRFGTEWKPAGMEFTGDELRAQVRVPNLMSMIDNKIIEVWPAPKTAQPAQAAQPVTAEDAPVPTLHKQYQGFGRYNVIRGTVVNTEPLGKEEAEAMVAAGNPTAN